MGRRKRHKLGCAFVLGVLAISLVIFEFRGEFSMPSVTPTIARRKLLTRHTWAPPNDVGTAINQLHMLSPMISPLPGDAPHESPGPRESAPTVQIAAQPIQPVSPAVQSPTPISPPPGVVQAPNVPTFAVSSPPSKTPILKAPPVSSPPLPNPPPLIASSPVVSQHVFPPVQSSPPKVASPPKILAHLLPVNNPPINTKGHTVSPTGTSTPTTIVAPSPLETPVGPSHNNSLQGRGRAPSPEPTSPIQQRERAESPVSAPPKMTSRHFSRYNSSHEADGPIISPATHKGKNAPRILHKPRISHAVSPTRSTLPASASTPAPAVQFHQRKRKEPSFLAPSTPPLPPKNRHKHHAPPISTPVPSISPSPFHSENGEEEAPSPAPTSSWVLPYKHHKHRGAAYTPVLSPMALPQSIRSLPPPPPNQDCTPLSCGDPYTNSPPGSPCTCVLPIKVGLRLSVSLYKFFNLVSQLAQEIASGVKLKQSQVRVMGANAATEDADKTVVLVDLVPLGQKFDNITALLVFDKFMHKEVYINPLYFGNYAVLYVIYPGLPPSPPAAPDGGMGNGNRGTTEHPLAADISKQREKQKAGIIAIIVLSSVFALVLFVVAAWFVIFKLRYGRHLPVQTPSSLTKASGTGVPFLTSQPSSITASFNSNMVTYKGTARTFTLFEMDRATNGFDESRLIGEGGFGRVYEGILGDGKHVAVKVLKRDDQQGSREFMAEVEMLSRLHHRNLVRLIGISTQENLRCLVYELVPNGSVESHLHGADKEMGPLDWDARLKIALGAARALAYLHEDSSPRVIHRDFKSSNILLEHDFTPKVSDFGLARAALGEDNEHISTRVMGTFGYVAPEYAMTGHLLVKSDVYSYGVVLLELLTGRKPVDMFRPPGQENLVTWARPLLTNQEGLESIADPSLGTVPFDSLARVAAIASMCVQPEVDQRPFMGEVVQALKLVCNEGNEYSKAASETDTSENVTSTSLEMGVFGAASSSPRFERDGSGSFRVYLGSGPLKTGHEVKVWERGSSSQHGVASRFGMDLEGSERYL
ncbi:Protein kinase superfamily protein [Rhynchospora pubera]|uniref:Protein kinase superfamily protein n=1 Tax=Rhynchospora pubera TaxID=906938 RepID=A0AAV8F9H3_9POAL|nr:Protein kinase superfamily protein [Rhynchospora pubera]